MTVGELKKMLEKYPDDMGVLVDRMSDYDDVEEDQFSVVKAVRNESGGWVMRSHATMSENNKAMEKEYLHLWGN